MPPQRPGSPPAQLVVRLTDLQHSLVWMRSQFVAGSFTEPQWLEQIDTLLPHNLLYPQSMWGHYALGLPTCECPNHWHILLYLEHWRDEELISRAKERLLTDYVMSWSGSGRRKELRARATGVAIAIDGRTPARFSGSGASSSRSFQRRHGLLR